MPEGARRVREGACGKRTAATPKPRPQAYLTLRKKERPFPVLSAPQQQIKSQPNSLPKKALTTIGASIRSLERQRSQHVPLRFSGCRRRVPSGR